MVSQIVWNSTVNIKKLHLIYFQVDVIILQVDVSIIQVDVSAQYSLVLTTSHKSSLSDVNKTTKAWCLVLHL